MELIERNPLSDNPDEGVSEESHPPDPHNINAALSSSLEVKKRNEQGTAQVKEVKTRGTEDAQIFLNFYNAAYIQNNNNTMPKKAQPDNIRIIHYRNLLKNLKKQLTKQMWLKEIMETKTKE